MWENRFEEILPGHSIASGRNLSKLGRKGWYSLSIEQLSERHCWYKLWNGTGDATVAIFTSSAWMHASSIQQYSKRAAYLTTRQTLPWTPNVQLISASQTQRCAAWNGLRHHSCTVRGTSSMLRDASLAQLVRNSKATSEAYPPGHRQEPRRWPPGPPW
ncbi:unnamed protein product [Prorocentrum cordatum]|uniref:Uncharacterized protein n=1 Tax=Prorocentrum cordatum TaxID=2364126 RepID=A0ABN9R3C1_9DINO|nr:unnamed protein product [Polarella glacialis]